MRRLNGPANATPYTPGQVDFKGNAKLSSFITCNPFYTHTVLKNTDGKFYFACQGKENLTRDVFTFKYDPTTNRIEQTIRTTISGVVTFDIHRQATLANDASGNIYMVAEDLQTPGNGGHASDIEVYKTSTPGNLSTLANISTINGRLSYAHIYNDGTRIFVFARGTTLNTFIRGQYWMFVSTNGGATFSAGTKIYDSGDEQKVAYFQRLQSHDGNLYLSLNERDNDDFNYKYIAVIKSTDNGVTWTNLAGTFSKVPGVAGAITRTEMRTNCMVYDSPNPTVLAVCFDGGVVKSDGTVKLLISTQTLTGESIPETGVEEVILEELRFYVYSGGAWSFQNVDIPEDMTFYWASDKPYRYMNNNAAYDDIVFIDHFQDRDVYIKHSTNNFATQTDTKILDGTGHSYRCGDAAFNAEDEDDYFLVLCDPHGDPDNMADGDNDGDYSDLTLLYVPNLE